jgi:hypothetical protein
VSCVNTKLLNYILSWNTFEKNGKHLYICKHSEYLSVLGDRFVSFVPLTSLFYKIKCYFFIIWTSTDIPNACRDIIVLYVYDGYSIFCFVHDAQNQVQDCVILIVIEVNMDNYTILQFINNHFTSRCFFNNDHNPKISVKYPLAAV